MPTRVQRVTEVDARLGEQLGRLVPQLSPGAPVPAREHLQQVASAPGCHLLVALDEAEQALGMLTLAVYPIPSGWRAWIEDVVVDQGARGRGVGAELVREALALARAQGVRSVDLTSNPSRAAANRLYPRLGFQQRQTNAYRIRLDVPE